MRIKQVFMYVLAIAVMVILTGRTEVQASSGVGEVSWLECQDLPFGYTTKYLGDKDSAVSKRIVGLKVGDANNPSRIYSTKNYEFNNNGDVIVALSESLNIYDESGRLIRIENAQSDGTLISWYTFIYDSEGKMEYESFWNHSSGYQNSTYYTYENGRLVSGHQVYDGEIYSVMGCHETFIDYEYDKNGNLTAIKRRWENVNSGEEYHNVRKFEYDKLGRLISVSFSINDGDESKTTYEYDSDGYLFRSYSSNTYVEYWYEMLESNKTARQDQQISVSNPVLDFDADKLEVKARSAKLKISANTAIKCKKVSGSKYVTVTKAGKIKVKKGTPAGTYTVKIKITAAGDDQYNSAKLTKKITVKVSKATD